MFALSVGNIKCSLQNNFLIFPKSVEFQELKTGRIDHNALLRTGLRSCMDGVLVCCPGCTVIMAAHWQ